MNRTATTIAGAVLALAAIAPAALAESSNDPRDSNTVLSIEGRTANMMLPMWVAVPKTGTTTVRDSAGAKVRITSRSVLAQALSGTREMKVPVRWTWYPAFRAPWITSIGGQGPKGLNGWNFRVNSLYLARAANRVNLSAGDRVTWYWGAEFATVLEIATPKTGIAPGAAVPAGQMTVTVNEVTSKNRRTPAVGATVTYGGSTATTDAAGTATLPTVAGTGVLRVTKAGRIAATKQVCTIGTSPDCPA